MAAKSIKSKSIGMQKIMVMVMDKLDVIEIQLDHLTKGFGSMIEHMKDLKVLSFNGDNKEKTMVEVESPTTKHINLILVQNKRLIDFDNETIDFSETQLSKLDSAYLCLISPPREVKLEKNKEIDLIWSKKGEVNSGKEEIGHVEPTQPKNPFNQPITQ